MILGNARNLVNNVKGQNTYLQNPETRKFILTKMYKIKSSLSFATWLNETLSMENLYIVVDQHLLKVTSDLLSRFFTKKLELPGTLDKKESIMIEIPVKSDLCSGNYKVACELEYADGNVTSFIKIYYISES